MTSAPGKERPMFGKKPPSALDYLTGTPWRCAGCGAVHREMFALACVTPEQWTGPDDYAPNHELRLDGDFLSEDFCVMGGQYFYVRCTVEVPVHRLADKFSFGVWSTLSRENFDIYVDGFDHSDYANMGPWFGWFSNRLPMFGETLNQKCRVHPQLNRQRPVLSLLDPDHPLSIAQDRGVSPEDAMGYYARYGCRPVEGA
jgi:hypothetical protein